MAAETESTFTDEQVAEAYRSGKCYLCGGTGWLSGPRGGLSENVECKNCGADLNVCDYPVVGAFVERIGWNHSGRFNTDGTLKLT